eukprot:gnl/TRDRNA2_/TRDRNA2_177571_c0_seq1.p1 gnl/TRDRNA2_/TRDRNA2_177571_c0~~gnl/TRDRNA2_/TRDRNA2_177571_c0_seq1.p1  ORF type:complete len:314 (-),score=-36.45 gnl/TRDRNA2_/TRDRNA2_177571_c0_seq1:186-1127(-)
MQTAVFRNLLLIIDWTISTPSSSSRLNQSVIICRILDQFIQEFFKLNPLSQVCILGTTMNYNIPISNNNRKLAVNVFLRNICNPMSPNWIPSQRSTIQEILHKTIKIFKGCPLTGTRETLILTSNTKLCISPYLTATLARIQNSRIRVNIVGINVEVFAFRQIATCTNGCYLVARNAHVDEIAALVQRFITAPILTFTTKTQSTLVGIPYNYVKSISNKFDIENYHCNHSWNQTSFLKESIYICPRCKNQSSILPNVCRRCGLMLLTKQPMIKTRALFRSPSAHYYIFLKYVKQKSVQSVFKHVLYFYAFNVI